jgi:hypothetical protein
MGFFDDAWDTVSSNPGKTIGTIFGGGAGLVAGIPGMIGGGMLGGNMGDLVWPGSGGVNSGDYSGMPGYPTFVGMQPDQLALAGKIPTMNAYNQEALKQGPSAWAQIANKQATDQAIMGKEQARKSAQGMAADAESNLAMKGGLGAGAQQTIQKQAMDQGMNMAQQAQDTGARNLASIAMDDARQHTAMLGNAANMNAGVMEGDLSRQQAENTKMNAFNLGRYQSQMAAWGAGKQADATANSGKHGFLGMGGK